MSKSKNDIVKENQKKIAVVAAVVGIVVVFAMVMAIIFGNSSSSNLIDQNEVLHTENFDITVNDFYNADFLYDEHSNFEKYVAAEVSIINTTDVEQKISTFMHFRLVDETDVAHQPLVDENYKKFSSKLQPGETFDITLVFAVDNSDKYQLYYNETLKEEDERVLGFELEGNGLETKKVENTVEHNYPDIATEEEGEENEQI